MLVLCLWFLIRRSLLVRMECPAWCSGGRRPLIAGCLPGTFRVLVLLRLDSGTACPLFQRDPVLLRDLGKKKHKIICYCVFETCRYVFVSREVLKYRSLWKSAWPGQSSLVGFFRGPFSRGLLSEEGPSKNACENVQ